jgi:hypothetical protein
MEAQRRKKEREFEENKAKLDEAVRSRIQAFQARVSRASYQKLPSST